jgi:hypothetical protein
MRHLLRPLFGLKLKTSKPALRREAGLTQAG